MQNNKTKNTKLYPVKCCNKLAGKIRGMAELKCRGQCKQIFFVDKHGKKTVIGTVESNKPEEMPSEEQNSQISINKSEP